MDGSLGSRGSWKVQVMVFAPFRKRLVLGGEDDVFELHLHRRACVHLKSDHAAFWSFCGFVGDVCGEFAVDVLLDAISLSDDFVFVPIVFVGCCL